MNIQPKFTLLFVILFIGLFSCAPRKVQYYQHLNDAYTNIIDGNYPASVKSFKKARRKINFFLAQDHYNAFQASLKANDLKFAEYNALKLAGLGMCYSFFEQYPQMTNNPETKNKIKHKCERDKKFNTFLSDSLYRMMDEDQHIHSNPELFYLRRYTDSINLEEFKMLVARYGFPKETSIGIDCTALLKGFQTPPYHILITHFAQNDFKGVNDLLKSWLDSMYITPSYFLSFNSCTNKGRVFAGGEVFYNNGSYYVEKPPSGTLAEIDRNRKKYGIWGIEDQMKIINLKHAGKLDDFRIDHSISTGLPFEIIEPFLIKIGEDVINNK